VVVRIHVGPAFIAPWSKRSYSILQKAFQDRIAETTRAGMNQDIGVVAIETGLGCDIRLEDFVDGLEFAEMIAAADAAEGRI
jgi:hypothetical protein